MSGFLNDLGLENVEADPNYIPDNKYPAFVYTSEIRDRKDGGKSWVITYKISDGTYAGRQQNEWFDLNPVGDKAEIKKSFLKRRLLSLGVPESKFGDLSPDDVVGEEVVIQIVHRNGYQNIGSVELAGGASGNNDLDL